MAKAYYVFHSDVSVNGATEGKVRAFYDPDPLTLFIQGGSGYDGFDATKVEIVASENEPCEYIVSVDWGYGGLDGHDALILKMDLDKDNINVGNEAWRYQTKIIYRMDSRKSEILAALAGNLVISNNQLILKDEDDNEVVRYNLYDLNGNPTNTAPSQRTLVEDE